METNNSPVLHDSGRTSVRAPNQPLPEKYIDRIFMRLAAIFGHKWVSLFPDATAQAVAKAEWSNALEPLSDFQIGQGLDRCRRIADWNPTIPEFIRYATNLPTAGVVAERVAKREAIDPISRHIIHTIGGYDLRRMDVAKVEAKAKELYPDAYEAVLPQVMGMDRNWQPPEQIEKQAEAEGPRTREAGEEAINTLREVLSA